MSIESQSHLPKTSGMSAEAGFDGEDIQAPIRISGFISLLLGLASIVSFLAIGAMIVPFLAIGFGLFGLRRHGQPTPVGITAARWGVIFAIGFGAFGLGVPLFKKHTLGTQAEYFAREFVKIVASGEDYYVLELQKDYTNRFLRTMSLAEHYEGNEEMQETLEGFRSGGLKTMLVKLGPDAKWELDRSVHVFHKYGRDNADVVLANYDGEKPRLIRVTLQKSVSSAGDIQWHVSNFMMYRERIVAPTVL
jgi:hypothetical protein